MGTNKSLLIQFGISQNSEHDLHRVKSQRHTHGPGLVMSLSILCEGEEKRLLNGTTCAVLSPNSFDKLTLPFHRWKSTSPSSTAI
jgi:hypothetical protein